MPTPSVGTSQRSALIVASVLPGCRHQSLTFLGTSKAAHPPQLTASQTASFCPEQGKKTPLSGSPQAGRQASAEALTPISQLCSVRDRNACPLQATHAARSTPNSDGRHVVAGGEERLKLCFAAVPSLPRWCRSGTAATSSDYAERPVAALKAASQCDSPVAI